jgi:hypothetical protein
MSATSLLRYAGAPLSRSDQHRLAPIALFTLDGCPCTLPCDAMTMGAMPSV